MTPSPLQTGLDALRRGDFAVARPHLSRATEIEPPGHRPWLPLARCCRRLGDAPAETRALQALLAEQPRDILALLLMGERKRDDGDDRAAASFGTAALKQAAVTPPPPQLAPLLDRARAFLAENNARYERHLLSAVDLPDADDERPTRFRR